MKLLDQFNISGFKNSKNTLKSIRLAKFKSKKNLKRIFTGPGVIKFYQP